MAFPGRKNLPALEELPLRKGDPPFSAWGLWENDQLGSLNYLTDENVLVTARDEIRTGARVGLDLPIDFITPALLNRVGFSKHIHNKAPRVINDDIFSLPSSPNLPIMTKDMLDHIQHPVQLPVGQLPSLCISERSQILQWVSPWPPEYSLPANLTAVVSVSQDDIHGDPNSKINSLQAWTAKGIAGRGVLIDYFDWAQKNDIQYDALTNHPFPIEHIKQIIAERNIAIRQGDILFLRTGYVQAYAKLNTQEREELSKKRGSPGLGQGKETAEWLWKSQFAAVVADSVAFECSPPVDPEYHLHPILLAGWGTPIEELFDLETLSEICKTLNRWSFFLTSAPLNYTGAVASPPNAIAFF